MTAIVEAVLFTVTVLIVVSTFTRLLARQQREHDRRVDLLVNQMCHLAGREWQPAPASEPWPAPASAAPEADDALVLEEA